MPISTTRFSSVLSVTNSFRPATICSNNSEAFPNLPTAGAVRSHTSNARFKTRALTALPFLRGSVASSHKKKVVILGTGWASMHFLKYLNPLTFDVSIVSPRNYFTFTPLLPSVAAGTLSPLSCIEPARNFTRHGHNIRSTFYEASCQGIDTDKNAVRCLNEAGDSFSLDFDYLFLGVGSDTNTFGIPGADRYALLLKEVEHAVKIRKTVMNNFERAALPGTSEEEKERLLHFVAVGAGPTGVETMAELSDFIYKDMAKYFPDHISYVRLTLVEATGTVLPMFSRAVAQYAMRTMLRHGKINVLLNHTVTKLRQKSIEIEEKLPGRPAKVINYPYGMVLWAVGVANTSLTNQLIEQLPEQQGSKKLKTNSQLQVLGTQNVFAMGDCKSIAPPSLELHCDQIISANHGHVPSSDFLRKHQRQLATKFPQLHKNKHNFWKKPLRAGMSVDQFKNYLKIIDETYASPLPTAQNARQEGIYLATIFNEFPFDDKLRTEKVHAFVEKWWGNLAYIGHGRAVASLPYNVDILGEFYSFPLWKTLYLLMQLSMRSRAVVSFDWFKVWSCGRDVGRDHLFVPGEVILRKTKQGKPGEEAEVEDEEVVISKPMTKALGTKLLDWY